MNCSIPIQYKHLIDRKLVLYLHIYTAILYIPNLTPRTCIDVCVYLLTLLNRFGSPVAWLMLSIKCNGCPMSWVGSSRNTSLSSGREPSCKQGSASTVSWPTSLPLKLVRGRHSWTSIYTHRHTHTDNCNHICTYVHTSLKYKDA